MKDRVTTKAVAMLFLTDLYGLVYMWVVRWTSCDWVKNFIRFFLMMYNGRTVSFHRSRKSSRKHRDMNVRLLFCRKRKVKIIHRISLNVKPKKPEMKRQVSCVSLNTGVSRLSPYYFPLLHQPSLAYFLLLVRTNVPMSWLPSRRGWQWRPGSNNGPHLPSSRK